jgi:uncharacterized protein DUF4262
VAREGEAVSHDHEDSEDQGICWECSNVRPGEDAASRRRRYVEDCETKIGKFGWMVQGVMGGVSPPWAYTVGLRQFNHPEIVVCNLPSKIAHGVLNGVAERVKNGEKFQVDQQYDHVISNYAVVFTEVEDPTQGDWFNVAEWVYGGEGRKHPVLQLWWPDMAGFFPWQEGYDIRYEQPEVGVDDA